MDGMANVGSFEARDVRAAVRLTIEQLNHWETALSFGPFAPDLSQVLWV